MNVSRTKASIKNIVVSVGIQLCTLFILFIQRTFFIHFLRIEYLGIDGLFSNILSILNMAELGFGNALVYFMYKPMANGDKRKLNLLLKLYAKVYNTIGIVVLGVGFLLTPFLSNIVREAPNIPHLPIIYCMYVLNTGLSYFFVYKSSIFIVAQCQYVINIYKFIFTFFQNILQVVTLYIFKNFIIYYSIAILSTFLMNFSISYAAAKKYPYIQQNTHGILTKEELSEIKRYVSAMFLNKFGWTILSGIDNILISQFFDVISVGIYSNYLLIVSTLSGLINKIYTAIIASIGNLAVTSQKKHSYDVFRKIYMMTLIIAGQTSICLFFLFNPFFKLWIGEHYVFSEFTVLLIVINYYISTVRSAAYTFDEAYGLFIHIKYKPLFESIAKLLFSIVLAHYIGIDGIFLGTIISKILFTFWMEPYVLYKYVFNLKITRYFVMFTKYFVVVLICAFLVWLISSVFSINDIIDFVIRILSCVIILPVIYLIFLYKIEKINILEQIKDRCR